MSTIEKTIEVDVPVRTAYDQWTQFETFPEFMDGVESVQQLDDKRLHWKASIAGVTRERDAEIVDQTPDERVTWRATEKAGDALNMVDHRAKADLDRFKEFFEQRGTETGAWRGEVNPGDA